MGEDGPRSGAAVLGTSRREAFEALYETFRAAARAAGGPIESDYELAGARIRARLAGPALEVPITRALAHLARAPGPAALTVCAWDNVSTGTSIPFPGVEWWIHGQAGPGANAEDDRICSYFHGGLPGLSVLDPGATWPSIASGTRPGSRTTRPPRRCAGSSRAGWPGADSP